MDSRLQHTTQALPPPSRVAREHGGHGFTFAGSRITPTARAASHGARPVADHTRAIDLTSDDAPIDPKPVEHKPEVVEWEEEGDVELPPAKRVKAADDEGQSPDEIMSGTSPDAAHELRPGTPLPAPPRSQTTSSRAAVDKRAVAPVESQARKPVNGIEPPTIAVRLPGPRKAADFAPWTGNHPEDILNETVVKAGYSDKAPSQNESGSARQSIWPNLSQKNHMGLQTLSYLFTQVLEKRQALGRCPTTSTFKPPPRVTVTDTKREAWLRDLANPSVPLRRQSRTIPHGIRGKLLMDQCLSKEIPLPRAVWLAKCVGANELRAFRRKGVSGAATAQGEAKWVREWTVAVEQFVEGVIATCGRPEWKAHMNYAVKLSMHFYVESLLDNDHYLDWIVSSLAQAPLDQLPIWLIMLQIYWKDITKRIARGRQLARCMLTRLDQLQSKNAVENQALQTRLESLVKALAMTNRACLVLPDIWHRFRHLLVPATQPTQPNTLDEAAAQNIVRRNERLCIATQHNGRRLQRGELLNLYYLLDHIPFGASTQKIALDCIAIITDPSQLSAALLNWSSTAFRDGEARVYRAAAIICELSRLGYDTDSGILSFLEATMQTGRSSDDLVYRVVAQLVELRGFSVGRYLQRLITGAKLSTENVTLAAGFLSAMPTRHLPMHLTNLRKTLLSRLGHAETRLESNTDFTRVLQHALHASNPPAPQLPLNVSIAQKLDLSTSIRECMRRLVETNTLQLTQFCLLRDLLMQIDDYTGVVELVHLSINTAEPVLFATVTDTINYHAGVFDALGHLEKSTDLALERYRELRSNFPLDRTAIASLLGLVTRLSMQAATVKHLENDLQLADQQNANAVCSPASDNLIGVQVSNIDTDDGIDAVFASGNSMDQQLMERIFTRILTRSTKQTQQVASGRSRICGWFRQLRCFDPTSFDLLAHRAVRTFVNKPGDHITRHGLIALVASGCISLHDVVNATKQHDAPSVAFATLQLMVLTDITAFVLQSEDKFRYQLAQQRVRDDLQSDVLSLFIKSLHVDGFPATNTSIQSMLIQQMTNAGDHTSLFNVSDLNEIARRNMSELLQSLVVQSDPRLSQHGFTLPSIITLAHPLTVGVCEVAVRFFMSSAKPEAEADTAMKDILVQQVESGNTVWPQLLQASGPTVQCSMHVWAREQLLSRDAEHDNLCERYLEVMEATCDAAVVKDETSILAALVERLRELEKQLADSTSYNSRDGQEEMYRTLTVLLQVTTLYIHSKGDTEASRQNRSNLLVALCALLSCTRLQTQSILLETISDLASLTYDNLPASSVASIGRAFEAPKTRNTLVEAIFGTTIPTGIDAWLAIASSASAPVSQQQRALNRHASIQQQSAMRSSSLSGSQVSQTPTRTWSGSVLGPGKGTTELKTAPYPLRRWEMMSDPTPVMGENDASLNLSLFGARKV